MKLTLLSVFDSKVQEYERPFIVRSIPEGSRVFGDECNRAESAFAKHPEDYTLYFVGHFDTETGELSSPAEPQLIVEAAYYERLPDNG